MPSRFASAFIRTANASSDPPTFSPTAMAMSLADLTSIIFSALSSVITEPGLKPILLGGSAAECLVTLMGESSASSPAATARNVT